jgi:type I restriction enzyme S subunit
LSVEVIGNIKVPCPPPSEQAAIEARLDQELSKMDATIQTATHLVAVLGERCSALISAAVTGQIDVRRLVEAGADER